MTPLPVADVVTLFVFANQSNLQVEQSIASATSVPLSAMVVLGRSPVPQKPQDAVTIGFFNTSTMTSSQAAAFVLTKASLGGIGSVVGAAPGYFSNQPVPTQVPAGKSGPSTGVIVAAIIGGALALAIIGVVVKKIMDKRTAEFDKDYIAMNSVNVNNYEHV